MSHLLTPCDATQERNCTICENTKLAIKRILRVRENPTDEIILPLPVLELELLNKKLVQSECFMCKNPSSGSRGPRGHARPHGPIKISHKKDGRQRRPDRILEFMFLAPNPPTQPLDPLVTAIVVQQGWSLLTGTGAVADPGFPPSRGWMCTNSKDGCEKLLFGQFCPKTEWNWKNLDPPPDPPMWWFIWPGCWT